MGTLSHKLYRRVQSPKYGGISLLATIVSGIVFLFIPTQFVLKGTFVVVSLTSLLIITSLRIFRPQIQMTCSQDNQFFSIENYHHRRYPVYNGYAEIEVFAEIPDWMTEFEIELESDGPFELSEWTPRHISRSDNTLICKSNIDDCKFTLQVIGESEELGDTTYNLRFKDGRSGKEIHSIKLVAERDLPRINEDELTEEEAEEWGLALSDV